MVASNTAMRWMSADLRSKITPSRGVCPRLLAISPRFLPFKDHQSSLANHQSLAPDGLGLATRSASSPSKINNHHSPIINPFLALPIRPAIALLLPLQRSTIITRQSSIHSSRCPFALPSPRFFPFKNHQSSLDNHQSIPRVAHSPCHTLCFLPLKDQQSSFDNHQSLACAVCLRVAAVASSRWMIKWQRNEGAWDRLLAILYPTS